MNDRERLAAKVRLLVGRSYKRAAAREWMRDQGFDVPDPVPHSWEAFEDHVYQTFRNADRQRTHRHLRVLDGGSEGSVVGRRPGPEDAASAVVGGKPSRVASAQPETHPTDLTGLGQGEPGEAQEEGVSSLSPSPYSHHRPPTTSTEES